MALSMGKPQVRSHSLRINAGESQCPCPKLCFASMCMLLRFSGIKGRFCVRAHHYFPTLVKIYISYPGAAHFQLSPWDRTFAGSECILGWSESSQDSELCCTNRPQQSLTMLPGCWQWSLSPDVILLSPAVDL